MGACGPISCCEVADHLCIGGEGEGGASPAGRRWVGQRGETELGAGAHLPLPFLCMAMAVRGPAFFGTNISATLRLRSRLALYTSMTATEARRTRGHTGQKVDVGRALEEYVGGWGC